MVAMNTIMDFGKKIGHYLNAQKVILFGSYAEGQPTEDSDVDFLVIADFQGRSVDQSVDVRMHLNPPFPMDIIIRTPEMIQKRLSMQDTFIDRILKQGKVLYEARHG
jgi:predicted nucleotidyltransferase